MKPLGPEREHFWRVLRMARTAGADPAAAMARGTIDVEGWSALVARCRACTWTGGCDRWLARFEAEDRPPADLPPPDCPNRKILAALARGPDEETRP